MCRFFLEGVAGRLLDDGVSAVPVVVLLAFLFAPTWVGVFSELKTGSSTNEMLDGGL